MCVCVCVLLIKYLANKHCAVPRFTSIQIIIVLPY